MKYFFFAVTSATAAQLEDSMEVANNWHSESQAWMSHGNMFRPAYKTQAMIMNPEPPVQHVLQGGSADHHHDHRHGTIFIQISILMNRVLCFLLFTTS